MLREVHAVRYVTALREGGSLPGLMEADDLGTYVVKFTGAGQGRQALIAEVICAELARALGLPVPELVVTDVDPALAANEPDEEIQDLLRRSPGANLGVDFLPGALDLDPAAFEVHPAFAGQVLWFDAFVGNVDRSWRNPNLLFWHGGPYLIDHGAALTFHHNWAAARAGTSRWPFDPTGHVLLRSAPDLAAAATFTAMLGPDTLASAVAAVPQTWLDGEAGFSGPDEVRATYVAMLAARLADQPAWLAQLHDAVAHAAPLVVPASRRPAWLDRP